MSKWSFLGILLLSFCTAKSHDEKNNFFLAIKDKTYHTWTFNKTLDFTQKFTVHQEGGLIQNHNHIDQNFFNLEFRELISDTQAIYLQKSFAPDLFVALVLSNDGNDVYYAFNPDATFTNNINWNCRLPYMKTK